MEKTYKTIPFDIEKAKAGAEVVTKKDKLKVEILKYDLKDDSPILAIINYNSGLQSAHTYYLNGKRFKNDTDDLDLRIKKEVKYRRMTHQELSWWLRDAPEEHREWRWTSAVYVNNNLSYLEKGANEECPEDILIRSNGGEWREPLIEIND